MIKIEDLEKRLWDNNPEFRAFVESVPDKHWSRYDLSAMRIGWEAHKEATTEIKPLITHDQIPWKWLKWDWLVANRYGYWINAEWEPAEGDSDWGFIGTAQVMDAIRMPSVPPERWRETKMRRPE